MPIRTGAVFAFGQEAQKGFSKFRQIVGYGGDILTKRVLLLAAVALLLVVTSAAAAEKAENEQFIKIMSSPLGEISFDTQSVKFIEKYDIHKETYIQIVEVEKKVIFSKLGVMSFIDKRKSAKLPTKGFEELSYILMRYQITLDKPRWMITKAVYYSDKGVEIDRYFSHDPKWEIVQDLVDSHSNYDIKPEKPRITITKEKNYRSEKGLGVDINNIFPADNKRENVPDLNDSRASYDKIMEYVKAHYYIPSPPKQAVTPPPA